MHSYLITMHAVFSVYRLVQLDSTAKIEVLVFLMLFERCCTIIERDLSKSI